MGAIAVEPDPLTSDAVRSGLGTCEDFLAVSRAAGGIPGSTLVQTTLLEEGGQDGARNGHRGTLWWPVMMVEFSYAWKGRVERNGEQITYNLEFSLSHMPKHLNLSLHSEVLSTSSRESSVEAAVSRRTSRKPGKELTKNQERLLAKMVHDDETWAEIGRHFPGHTLQSLKENFFTKQRGKPRVKIGVKGDAVLERREYN